MAKCFNINGVTYKQLVTKDGKQLDIFLTDQQLKEMKGKSKEQKQAILNSAKTGKQLGLYEPDLSKANGDNNYREPDFQDLQQMAREQVDGITEESDIIDFVDSVTEYTPTNAMSLRNLEGLANRLNLPENVALKIRQKLAEVNKLGGQIVYSMRGYYDSAVDKFVDDNKTELDDESPYKNGESKGQIFKKVKDLIKVTAKKITVNNKIQSKWEDKKLEAKVKKQYDEVLKTLSGDKKPTLLTVLTAIDIVLGDYSTYKNTKDSRVFKESVPGTYGKVRSILESLTDYKEVTKGTEIRKQYENGEITLQEVVDQLQEDIKNGAISTPLDELVLRTGHDPKDLAAIARKVEDSIKVDVKDAEAYYKTLFGKADLKDLVQRVKTNGFADINLLAGMSKELDLHGLSMAQMQTLAFIQHVVKNEVAASKIKKAERKFNYLLNNFATPLKKRQFAQAYKGYVYTNVLANPTSASVVTLSYGFARAISFVADTLAARSIKEALFPIISVYKAIQNNSLDVDEVIDIIIGIGIDRLDTEQDKLDLSERSHEFVDRNLQRIIEKAAKDKFDPTILKDVLRHTLTQGSNIVPLLDYLMNAFAIPYENHLAAFTELYEKDKSAKLREITKKADEALYDNKALRKEIEHEIEEKGLTGDKAKKYRRMRARQLAFDFVDAHTRQSTIIKIHEDSVTGTLKGKLGLGLAKVQKAMRENRKKNRYFTDTGAFIAQQFLGTLFPTLISNGGSLLASVSPLGYLPYIRGKYYEKMAQKSSGSGGKAQFARKKNEHGKITTQVREDFYFLEIIDKASATTYEHTLTPKELRVTIAKATLGTALMSIFSAMLLAGIDDDEKEETGPRFLVTTDQAFKWSFTDENGQQLRPYSIYRKVDGKYRMVIDYKDKAPLWSLAGIGNYQAKRYFTEEGEEGMSTVEFLATLSAGTFNFLMQFGPGQFNDMMEMILAFTDDKSEKGKSGRAIKRGVKTLIRTNTPGYSTARAIETITRKDSGSLVSDGLVGSVLDNTTYNVLFETEKSKKLGITEYPYLYSPIAEAIIPTHKDLSEKEKVLMDIRNRFTNHSTLLRRFNSDDEDYISDGKRFIEYNYTMEEMGLLSRLAGNLKAEFAYSQRDILLGEDKKVHKKILKKINSVSNDLVKAKAIADKIGDQDEWFKALGDEIGKILDNPQDYDITKIKSRKRMIYNRLKRDNLMITDNWKLIDKDKNKVFIK